MTNERLEALKAERKRLLTPNAGTFVSAMELACQAIAALDELLALREAGDDEVVCLAEEYQLGETELHRIQTYKNLEGIAITRGQQLREALAENNRYHDEAEVADALVLSLQEEVKTLTAERDEARKDLEQVRVQCAACLTAAAEGYTPTPPLKQGDWAWTPAYQQTWELRQKYDAIKSAPSMAEVDVLSGDFTVEECDQPCLTTWMQRNKKLADLARRSIASREEAVGKLSDTEGLIKWMVKHWDWTGKLEDIAKGCVIKPWKENARLVLEIVEGE